MKNVLMVLSLLVCFAVSAQERGKERGKAMKELTAQQIAELQTKKMTLHLDLSAKQQKEVEKINLDIATKRKAMAANREKGKELSTEERYAMRSNLLDEKIAVKKKMKDVLNDEQYLKWEKAATMKKKGKMKRGMKKGEKRKEGKTRG